MLRTLSALFLLSSNRPVPPVDARAVSDSHVVRVVQSLRSGGRDNLRANSTTPLVCSGAIGPEKQTSPAVVAWSLPTRSNNAGRKREGYKWKRAKRTNERTRAPLAKTKGEVSRVARASSIFTKLTGAIVAGGCALGLWSPAGEASPFDPRPPPKCSLQPFFEGWFIRLVDHEQRLSFAVIFGSFRSRGGKELDQHYVSLSYLHEPKGGLQAPWAGCVEEPAGLSAEKGDDRREGTGERGASAGASVSEMRVSKRARERWLTMQRGFGVERRSDTPGHSWGGIEGKLDAGGAGQGDTALVGAPYDEYPSTWRETGVDVDVDVEADRVRDKAKDPSGEAEGAAVALESEHDADVAHGEGGEMRRIEGCGMGHLRTEGGVDIIEGPHATTVLSHRDANKELVEMEAGSGDEATIGVTVTTAGAALNETIDACQGSLEHPSPPSGTTNKVNEVLDDPPRHSNENTLGRRSREASSERTHTFHAFPPPETVTISRLGKPVVRAPNLIDDSSFTWEADGIGFFEVDGDTGRLSFQLPELSVAASFRNRQPWSRKRPNGAGPEGWLAGTGLLPLHYFVHSLGSEAGYSLKAADVPRPVVGRGSIHMEANYGTSFPTGWVWAQGCSATEGVCGKVFRDGEVAHDDADNCSSEMHDEEGDEESEGAQSVGVGGVGGNPCTERAAKFVLTGGRFVIGPATTNSFVMAFRSRQHHWDFRTTDLDRISLDVRREENRLKIVARSRGGDRVLEADIRAPEGSFGSAIYVPTPEGFSNAPGCIESYAATATFRLYTKGREGEGFAAQRFMVLREEVDFKLAALEFGGSFQDT